jgi:circadian clock protein KaiB
VQEIGSEGSPIQLSKSLTGILGFDEITGGLATRASFAGFENIKSICKDHLEGRYKLEVIDVYQQPELARDRQVIAAPTLIKELPPPLRRFIGDLSDKEKILVRLDLVPKKENTQDPDRG